MYTLINSIVQFTQLIKEKYVSLKSRDPLQSLWLENAVKFKKQANKEALAVSTAHFSHTRYRKGKKKL